MHLVKLRLGRDGDAAVLVTEQQQNVCFGITIWPFSPTVAVQAYFPSGRFSSGSPVIKSSGVNMVFSFVKYDLYNISYFISYSSVKPYS